MPLPKQSGVSANGGRLRRSRRTSSRLRSLLGAGSTGEPVLQRTGGGLRPGSTGRPDRCPPLPDAGRTDPRVAGGRQTGVGGRLCGTGTALWRGRPYSPLSDEPWVAPAVARLDELYAQVRERLLEGLLAVGDTERALVELRTEIPARPLRERLWALRMLAEYRTGRLDEALRTFHAARTLFLDELGVEPSGSADESAGRDPGRRPRPRRPAGSAASATATRRLGNGSSAIRRRSSGAGQSVRAPAGESRSSLCPTGGAG